MPLWAAVARSNGHTRPAAGKRDSAHSVAACRPWLSTAAGAACARRVAATSRSSRRRSPAAARCSAAGTPGNPGSAMLSAVSASSTAGPFAPRASARCRSRAGSVGHRPHAARRTRPVARRLSCSVASTPVCGTTDRQDQTRDVARMSERVALGDVRAVRDAHDPHSPGVERAPQRVEVGDDLGGRVERPGRAERAARSRARPTRAGRSGRRCPSPAAGPDTAARPRPCRAGRSSRCRTVVPRRPGASAYGPGTGRPAAPGRRRARGAPVRAGLRQPRSAARAADHPGARDRAAHRSVPQRACGAALHGLRRAGAAAGVAGLPDVAAWPPPPHPITAAATSAPPLAVVAECRTLMSLTGWSGT